MPPVLSAGGGGRGGGGGEGWAVVSTGGTTGTGGSATGVSEDTNWGKKDPQKRQTRRKGVEENQYHGTGEDIKRARRREGEKRRGMKKEGRKEVGGRGRKNG